MLNPAIESQILEELYRLKPEQQQKVLEFARDLTGQKTPKGVPASQLFELAKDLFDKADVEEMMKVIEEDCERIE